MLAHFLKETKCHACESTIGRGQLICRSCGRFRGVSGRFQFKQWELTLATVGVSLVGCFLCFAVAAISANIGAGSGVTNEVPDNQAPEPIVSLSDSEQPPPVITSRPTSTRLPKSTSTPESDFARYSCPDKSKVELRVGDQAIVAYYDVNLRSSPIVPDVWDANIVRTLHEGDKMSIIGGPECAHEGSWWEVKTDTGYTGWVREQQPNKIIIKPLK